MNIISIIIPTFNEEEHLKRLLPLLNAAKFPFYCIDSNSTDSTISIIESYGGKVYQGSWNDFGEKLNYGINLNPYNSEWIMRIDADEYIENISKKDDVEKFLINLKDDIDAILVKRKIIFLGKWIRFGGIYPGYTPRIFRKNRCVYEKKIIDEHVYFKNSLKSKIVIRDDPYTNIEKWTLKHLRYASVNKIGYFSEDYSNLSKAHSSMIMRAYQILYSNIPMLIRPLFYFIYRYFLRLGFLDGKVGLIYHFLHAFWYRFYSDALIQEVLMQRDKRIINKHSA